MAFCSGVGMGGGVGGPWPPTLLKGGLAPLTLAHPNHIMCKVIIFLWKVVKPIVFKQV